MIPKLLKNQSGLTLIEILAVIVLISLIMAVVAKGVIGKSDAAQAQLNKVKMEKLKHSLAQYRLQYGTYPSRLDNLIKPSGEVRRSGDLFTALAEPEDLKDIWNYPYQYRAENNNRSYALTSLGADGITGGESANQDLTVKP